MVKQQLHEYLDGVAGPFLAEDLKTLQAVGTYTPGMFKLKPKKGGKTPHARAERKTTRELSDAEIEQRREAARKSALARRKAGSDDRTEQWKTATLQEKVAMASEIELAALARQEELESQLRATEDPGLRADIQGELDDIRDMLSAKDEWLRNARYDEMNLADQQIEEQTAELESLRDGFSRNLESLHDQQRSIDLQIEAARDAGEQNREAADRIRTEARDMRTKAAELRARAGYASSEIQRIELENAARELDTEADARDKAAEESGPSQLDALTKQRREVSNKISDMNTQRTRAVADKQRAISDLRRKREAISKQYEEATEYLRRARGTAPGRTSKHREGQFLV
jgi:chromosome segregation ATPase